MSQLFRIRLPIYLVVGLGMLVFGVSAAGFGLALAGGGVVCLVVGLWALLVFVCWLRYFLRAPMSLVISPSGILVTRLLGEREIPWSQVSEVRRQWDFVTITAGNVRMTLLDQMYVSANGENLSSGLMAAATEAGVVERVQP